MQRRLPEALAAGVLARGWPVAADTVMQDARKDIGQSVGRRDIRY